MIRSAQADDVEAIVSLVILTGMFADEDAGFVRAMMADFFAHAGSSSADLCVIAEAAGVVVGVAYSKPLPATDRVWDLTMLASDPTRQRSGIGTELLEFVESRLREIGQRILVIETSSTDQFAGARAFYAKGGYRIVAQVPDYWEDGDDLVMFLKRL